MTEDFELVLDGTVDAPARARGAIAANYPTLAANTSDDLRLLVTELVTNAMRHGYAGAAPPPIELGFRRYDGVVRVRVVDAGTDFEHPPAPSEGDSNGGWGLFLVDRIAERWGVCPAPSGTCVWFEVTV